MKTQQELMVALQGALDEVRPEADAGDDGARVKMAFGEALYEYMAEGHRLTDLDWFKNTSYYTGTGVPVLKAA